MPQRRLLKTDRPDNKNPIGSEDRVVDPAIEMKRNSKRVGRVTTGEDKTIKIPQIENEKERMELVHNPLKIQSLRVSRATRALQKNHPLIKRVSRLKSLEFQNSFLNFSGLKPWVFFK
jgi:hypothetical protein